MLAARKLDANDPKTTQMLRLFYSIVQCISVILITYYLLKASQLKNTKEGMKVVYVPPAPQPFADPNGKKKYTETTFAGQCYSTASSLSASTFFGILLTVGLHVYKGIVVGLTMQCVMGPLTLFESPLTKLFVMGESKVFGEKTKEELTPDDEVVDSKGNPVVMDSSSSAAAVTTNKPPPSKEEKSFNDVLLDVWDLGTDADITPVMDILTESNVNSRTNENKWTPLMIVSGLDLKETPEAFRKLKALGADPELVDAEGWNSLHWAAFHGNLGALNILLSENDGFEAANLGIHLVKDKEGKLPLDLAKAEENDTIVEVLEKLEYVLDNDKCETQDDGLRKRK